jgi:hypothetical protein
MPNFIARAIWLVLQISTTRVFQIVPRRQIYKKKETCTRNRKVHNQRHTSDRKANLLKKNNTPLESQFHHHFKYIAFSDESFAHSFFVLAF